MDQETISLKAVVRKETIVFHLREIDVAEDEEYSERHVQIADKKSTEKAKLRYQIYVSALAAWSAEMPTIANGDGKEKPLGTGSPAEAIKEYFKESSPSKERMLRAVIGNYRNSLYPDVTFVEHSV